MRDAIAQLGGDPLRAAYEVQRVNTERRLTSGERLVGCTVGLTSRAVQAQLGVDQPDFGMLFDAMAVADGEEIAMSRTQQAKVEAEIALVLE
ncbi:2-keto-4-pentenoate hydratase [Paraburkholderia phenoliruptrix]|nr:2-keto-4-pentenoate hydratase [Paraburkholderia phenoliruptrix]